MRVYFLYFKVAILSCCAYLCICERVYRVAKVWAPSLCGRLVMEVDREITAHVMATPTASIPSLLAAARKTATSPGIWKSARPPWPPPTAAESSMIAK